MIIGLVPFSAQYLFQRVFYAFTDARTPFWVQVLVIAPVERRQPARRVAAGRAPGSWSGSACR